MTHWWDPCMRYWCDPCRRYWWGIPATWGTDGASLHHAALMGILAWGTDGAFLQNEVLMGDPCIMTHWWGSLYEVLKGHLCSMRYWWGSLHEVLKGHLCSMRYWWWVSIDIWLTPLHSVTLCLCEYYHSMWVLSAVYVCGTGVFLACWASQWGRVGLLQAVSRLCATLLPWWLGQKKARFCLLGSVQLSLHCRGEWLPFTTLVSNSPSSIPGISLPAHKINYQCLLERFWIVLLKIVIILCVLWCDLLVFLRQMLTNAVFVLP